MMGLFSALQRLFFLNMIWQDTKIRTQDTAAGDRCAAFFMFLNAKHKQSSPLQELYVSEKTTNLVTLSDSWEQGLSCVTGMGPGVRMYCIMVINGTCGVLYGKRTMQIMTCYVTAFNDTLDPLEIREMREYISY